MASREGLKGFPPSHVALHVRLHVKDMSKETFSDPTLNKSPASISKGLETTKVDHYSGHSCKNW